LLFSRKVKTDALGKLVLVILLCFLAWIAVVLLGRLHEVGTDVYANDVSPIARLKLLTSFVSLPAVTYWLAALLVFATLTLALHAVAGHHPTAQRVVAAVPLRSYLIAEVALLVVYASQYVIYNGNWPLPWPSRYQFPGILAFHFAILLGVVVCVRLVEAITLRSWPVLAVQLVAAAGLVVASVSFLNLNRSGSLAFVKATRRFEHNMSAIVDNLRAHPSNVLIINYHHALDFEPIHSIQRFVRAAGIANPVAVRPGGSTIEKAERNPLHEQLVAVLLDISKNGRPGLFIPLGDADQVECFSVGVSGSYLGSCRDGGVNISR
jgi:hypothetical protein